MTKTEEKFNRMTTEKIGKLLASLSAPAICSMLVTAIYNAADSYFVSSIGDSATGSVGVVFSFMSVLQTFGFMFGHGSGNYMSRQLGKKDYKTSGEIAVTATVLSFCVGLVLSVAGLCCTDRLALFLGSTETILPYARQYLRFILIAAPFQTAALTMNNQLRFQGNAKYGMLGLGLGAVLNMIMDPIFIFVFKWGVTGAGLATMISQIISFVILIVCSYHGGNLPMKLSRFSLKKFYLAEIFRGGIPSFGRNVINSVATILLNYALKANCETDSAIAAVTVVLRITWMIQSVLIGIGQGFQPICGMNYGAKKYSRVLKALKIAVLSGTAVLCAGSIIGIAFARPLISLFAHEPETIATGIRALRYYCIPLTLSASYAIGGMLLQNLGKSLKATVLAISRQGIVFMPLVLILPRFFGLTGALVAQPVADLITILISIPMLVPEIKELLELKRNREITS